MENQRPRKIISGGQTGADQGGLEGARRCGIATGGTAPKLYRTERGTEADLLKAYGLVESPYWSYPPRTRQNVHDADLTIWIGRIGSPGYYCTKSAVLGNMPENPSPEELRALIQQFKVHILNVAGNRESTNPGIYEKTIQLVVEAFQPVSLS